MKRWVSNNKLHLAGAVTGTVAGYLYWQQIGCSSSTCMITSSPVISTLYGTLMDALLFSMFKKESKSNL